MPFVTQCQPSWLKTSSRERMAFYWKTTTAKDIFKEPVRSYKKGHSLKDSWLAQACHPHFKPFNTFGWSLLRESLLASVSSSVISLSGIFYTFLRKHASQYVTALWPCLPSRNIFATYFVSLKQNGTTYCLPSRHLAWSCLKARLLRMASAIGVKISWETLSKTTFCYLFLNFCHMVISTLPPPILAR